MEYSRLYSISIRKDNLVNHQSTVWSNCIYSNTCYNSSHSDKYHFSHLSQVHMSPTKVSSVLVVIFFGFQFIVSLLAIISFFWQIQDYGSSQSTEKFQRSNIQFFVNSLLFIESYFALVSCIFKELVLVIIAMFFCLSSTFVVTSVHLMEENYLKSLYALVLLVRFVILVQHFRAIRHEQNEKKLTAIDFS